MLAFQLISLAIIAIMIAILLTDWVEEPIPAKLKPHLKKWSFHKGFYYVTAPNGGVVLVDGGLVAAINAIGLRDTPVLAYDLHGGEAIAEPYLMVGGFQIRRHKSGNILMRGVPLVDSVQ